MGKTINIISIINVSIEHNKKYLEDIFFRLEKSTLINNSLFKNEFEKLKMEIKLFKNTSKTLESLLKKEKMEEFTSFYRNNYLKDYQEVINSISIIQKESLLEYKKSF